jgi:hypothetical protein
MDDLLQSLRIPAEYGQNEPDALGDLGPWKQSVYPTLAALGDMVARKRATAEQLDDSMLADIVFYLSPLSIAPEHDGLDLSPWTDQLIRRIALGMQFRHSARRSMIKIFLTRHPFYPAN